MKCTLKKGQFEINREYNRQTLAHTLLHVQTHNTFNAKLQHSKLYANGFWAKSWYLLVNWVNNNEFITQSFFFILKNCDAACVSFIHLMLISFNNKNTNNDITNKKSRWEMYYKTSVQHRSSAGRKASKTDLSIRWHCIAAYLVFLIQKFGYRLFSDIDTLQYFSWAEWKITDYLSGRVVFWTRFVL